VAIDEAAQVLYVADRGNDRVRAIDLATGLISTAAGGGAAVGPAFGDGGPATGAVLSGPANLTFANGKLYISDNGHGRIRVFDPATGLVSNWLSGTPSPGCGVIPTADLSGLDAFNGQVAFDAQGNGFVSATVVGTAFNHPAPVCSGVYGIPGVLKRAPNGTLTAVAGSMTSWTCGSATCTSSHNPGSPASSWDFAESPAIALDAGGNLYLAETSRNRVLSLSSGKLNAYSGDGTAAYAGDLVPFNGPGVQYNRPSYLGFLSGGRLAIADSGNYSLRMVWQPSTVTQPVACGAGLPACPGTQTCVNSICSCLAQTDGQLCASKGAVCGPVTATDACGQLRTVASCGGCGAGQTCGAGASANQCVCPAANTCGGGCFDLQNDPNNCGACGVSCGDGACSAGRCADLQLASGLYYPALVAATTNAVFFTDKSDAIYKLPQGKLNAAPTLFTTGAPGRVRWLRAAGSTLLFANDNYNFFSIPESGGTATLVYPWISSQPVIGNPNTTAVAQEGSKLYFAQAAYVRAPNSQDPPVLGCPSGGCVISSVNLDGTGVAAVTTAAKPVYGLAAGGGGLYYGFENAAPGSIIPVDATIYSVPLAGGATKSLGTGYFGTRPGESTLWVDGSNVWADSINPLSPNTYSIGLTRFLKTGGAQSYWQGAPNYVSKLRFDGSTAWAVGNQGLYSSPLSSLQFGRLYGTAADFDLSGPFLYVTDPSNGVVVRLAK
jgi:hypothetical protein